MSERLYDRIARTFLWIAAFCLATGVFFSFTLLFWLMPPTPPVAIGLVTIQQYAKSRDYLGALLFFLLVPPLTIWLRGVFDRATRRYGTTQTLLFALPYLLSPFFYLTTGQVGWILLLPIALSAAAPRLFGATRGRLWVRSLFRRELRGYHALVFTEALSWILFRYLVTGRRIAHVSTLFLEIVFAAMFLALFWAVAIVTARIAELSLGRDADDTFARIATAGLPMVVLPFLAAAFVPMPSPRLAVAAVLLIAALIAMRIPRPMRASRAWGLAAYALIPALIYLVSYVSTAQLSQWIDLFHRGETLGPASDYLRGKVPFRDVLALHGMLDDGLLDAWLMELFGRSLQVAIARSVVLGAFLGVSIWYLGIIIFESIPLALACVAMGAWTTAENDRTFFQVAAAALFWNGLRRRSRFSAAAAGAFAAVALFFSYEIGLYTIAGAVIAALLVRIGMTRVEWDGFSPLRAVLWFGVGVVAGAAPFIMYLAANGALGSFVEVSFVQIPKIIDAVWSLPFPDLVTMFRKDLNIHTLADFVLWEKFHLILSPLTIAIAAVYLIDRWRRRRADTFDFALLVLTVFSAIAQRTAFGRAEFRHQYFAAFLIGPMLVLLAVLIARQLAQLWRDGSEGTRAFVATLVVVSVPILGVLFWIPDLVNARIDDVVNYYARVLHVYRDPHAEEVAARIADVTTAVDHLTRRNEPIFDFSNQPAFYFFTNRPNPTRFYQVPILSPAAFQAEAIRTLERTKPKVVIRRSPERFDEFDGVPNTIRAQALAAYVDDMYRYYQSARGVEIWTRRAGTPTHTLAQYLRLVHLPRETELASSATTRMVFPAVGSIAGVGGSFWQSDLTLHNALREPLSLTLRYSSGDNAIDRHITLAPRQTLRWPDVARDLFASGGSFGSLWIEHREGKAPIAVVKTSDIAHAGRGSIVRPLTLADSATAQSENSELVIVGVPAAPAAGRRMNLGVVNVGDIPATFRITVRGANGAVIGRAVESGVPERQVWLVPGLESAIGVTLDETMTIRIKAIAGTGVAFATAVDSEGNSEYLPATPAQQP